MMLVLQQSSNSTRLQSRTCSQCRGAPRRQQPPSECVVRCLANDPCSDGAVSAVFSQAPPVSRVAGRRELMSAAVLATLAAGLVGQPAPAQAAAAASSSTARDAGAIREYRMVARVTALRGSVPAQWPADFQAAMENYGLVAMTQKPHLRDIYAELRGSAAGGKQKRGRGGPTTADAVTMGDVWLQRVIAEGLIQPIPDAREQRWWSLLHPRWKQLICRTGPPPAGSSSGSSGLAQPSSWKSSSSNRGGGSSSSSSAPVGVPDPRGEVWGAPYRWGCTLIGYNRSKLLRRGGRPVQDWGDLLQPELQGQVVFHDSPREVVGVVMKTLGLSSINATAADAAACGLGEDDLARRLQRLLQQVRVFSNTDHVRALLAGDALAIVGSSEDLIPLADRMTDLELVAPLSGTALWADLWCIPTHAAGGAVDGEPSPLLPAWFELGLQPARAEPSQGLRGGASPLLLPPPARPAGRGSSARACSPLDPHLSGSSQLSKWMPSEEVLQRSEFLLPLADTGTRQLYQRLLQGTPAS